MVDNNAGEQIFFPVRQADSASQLDSRSLLARPIYRSLRQLIYDRLEDASRQELRAIHRHVAVLVDGERGTGKSSVLSNLTIYLKSEDRQLLDQVNVIKPIDPTLLEDHDDLFLNIVVAAVLSDNAVKGAMAQDSEARTAVHKRLHHLGHALENMQTQRDKKGLDKIRAFIGNQELVDQIHEFFGAVLKLIGKKLLILPIDDVDTSLHRAFENLEVVRRYLTSPLVLPVISGDAELYHNVTWRDFHGRLLKDSRSDRMQAQRTAQHLATEYHRKVLPLQYRLSMPTMREYFNNDSISLGSLAGGKLTFPHFHAWLETLLNDRTNGVENSHLPVPVGTMRAFAQLVYRVSDLIPALDQAISANNLNKEELRHYMLMPDLPSEVLQAFKSAYQSTVVTGDERTRRNSRDVAYSDFARLTASTSSQAKSASPLAAIPIAAWTSSLKQHFRYDSDAGAAYLVLKAYEDWDEVKQVRGDLWVSVFDTPLFQPQRQTRDYSEFNAIHDLSEWKGRLAGRLPESWLKHVPNTTILPYPVPEIGPLVSDTTMQQYVAAQVELDQRLLAELLLHRNFYQPNKTGVLLCVGRIFEILITSLLRDMRAADISTILNRPPFYSFASLAQTKTLDDSAVEEEELPEADAEPIELDLAIVRLADSINMWRKELRLEKLRLSPWLVYNVMNKFFNQAWLFNAPAKPLIKSEPFDRVAWVARKAFNSIWAAFGSFEKGYLFGLPPIIATVNVGDGQDFQNSDLYRQNITPFVGITSGASQFGLRVGAITTVLEKHPLKVLTDQLRRGPIQAASVLSVARGTVTAEANVAKLHPSEWLFEKTGKKQFNAAAREMQAWSDNRVTSALSEYLTLFKNSKLRDAYERVTSAKEK